MRPAVASLLPRMLIPILQVAYENARSVFIDPDNTLLNHQPQPPPPRMPPFFYTRSFTRTHLIRPFPRAVLEDNGRRSIEGRGSYSRPHGDHGCESLFCKVGAPGCKRESVQEDAVRESACRRARNAGRPGFPAHRDEQECGKREGVHGKRISRKIPSLMHSIFCIRSLKTNIIK